ncbi:MAG: hypothetical protein AB1486_06845 [Planctomycetota bacterium]
MNKAGIPIVILAGSDRRPAAVPRGAESYHFLVGYKGARVHLQGQPLVRLLEQRLRQSAILGDVYLAGPRAVFEGLVDCAIIDTDRDIGRNIRATVDYLRERHGPETPIAFIASDILPETQEIDALVRDLMVPPAPSVGPPLPAQIPFFAWAMVHPEGALGASSWKPQYGIRPARDQPPLPFLPAHLAIIRPRYLRMRLLYRILQLAYEVRNRDFGHRRRVILTKLLWMLVRRDVANLFSLRAPTLTTTVLRHGLATISRWRKGVLDIEGLARGIAAVIVSRRLYRSCGAAAVRILVTPYLSFAKDLDTREEVTELEGELPSDETQAPG